ncbi:MAG: ABC transporter permease, partial [Firmicutes bacterium]|nr:ABC transporter permease [Bacillota bacterium]
MFLTKLALKNLARHRNRTLITASIIAFAVFFYLILDSLIGGLTELSYDMIINYQAGHLQVVTEEYWAKEEKLLLENLITPNPELMAALKNVPGYQGSSAELNFQAMLSNGVNELPVIGRGINPPDFGGVINLTDHFVEGEMFHTGGHGTMGVSPVVIGKRLADLLKLQTGDYITLLVKDKNETFNTIEAEITGVVHTGNPLVNEGLVYLPLAVAQEALNVGDQVSKVLVRLENKKQAPGVAKELAGQLKAINPQLAVYSWDQLEAVAVAGAKQMGNQLIMTVILLIAAIAIINTVILAALERMKEIGMMKAMGLQTKEIIYTFVLESTGIGILGGICGVLLGLVGVGLFTVVGLDFSTVIDMAPFGIPVVGKIYGVWNPAS